MEKEKLYKIFAVVYFVIILLIAFWPLKNLLSVKSTAPSRFEVLNTTLLDSANAALDSRSYININTNSIDINTFTFGNPNPFR